MVVKKICKIYYNLTLTIRFSWKFSRILRKRFIWSITRWLHQLVIAFNWHISCYWLLFTPHENIRGYNNCFFHYGLWRTFWRTYLVEKNWKKDSVMALGNPKICFLWTCFKTQQNENTFSAFREYRKRPVAIMS